MCVWGGGGGGGGDLDKMFSVSKVRQAFPKGPTVIERDKQAMEFPQIPASSL